MTSERLAADPGPARRHEPTTPGDFFRHYLRDLVYGANDGIITTFAIVSGVAGAGLSSRVIIVLGVANLLADGFSMGASNFLSIRSDEAVRAALGQEEGEPYPARHGGATFAAFVVAGAVPLMPFLLPLPGSAFAVATAATLLTLFAVGALRAMVTRLRWQRAGMEMLLVGAAAALVAYGVGAMVSGIVPAV